MALFAALLVAAVIVAGVVVHARTPKLELEILRIPHKPFAPSAAGRRGTARVTFFVRDSDPNATVQIVGPGREAIRTLYRGRLIAYTHYTFAWNGRTNEGGAASPSQGYRLRVSLPSQDRDMVYPTLIRITEPRSQ